MSFCARPTVAAKKHVTAPMIVIMFAAKTVCSYRYEQRQTRKTPAVTMVAAWISAETGVGPSIASGSHVCRKNWADLPIAPMNSSTPTTSRPQTCTPRKSNVTSWIAIGAPAPPTMTGALLTITLNTVSKPTDEKW